MSEDVFADFIAKWTHPDYPPQRVVGDWRGEVETKLGVNLPDALVQALTDKGCPSTTIALLHSVVESGQDMADASDFLTPEEMVSVTRDWRELGMDPMLAAVATDCSGNLFGVRSGQPAIWLWDHDTGETRQVAESFETWIAAFNAVTWVDPFEDDDTD